MRLEELRVDGAEAALENGIGQMERQSRPLHLGDEHAGRQGPAEGMIEACEDLEPDQPLVGHADDRLEPADDMAVVQGFDDLGMGEWLELPRRQAGCGGRERLHEQARGGGWDEDGLGRPAVISAEADQGGLRAGLADGDVDEQVEPFARPIGIDQQVAVALAARGHELSQSLAGRGLHDDPMGVERLGCGGYGVMPGRVTAYQKHVEP